MPLGGGALVRGQRHRGAYSGRGAVRGCGAAGGVMRRMGLPHWCTTATMTLLRYPLVQNPLQSVQKKAKAPCHPKRSMTMIVRVGTNLPSFLQNGQRLVASVKRPQQVKFAHLALVNEAQVLQIERSLMNCVKNRTFSFCFSGHDKFPQVLSH